jgi:hypothetical protein
MEQRSWRERVKEKMTEEGRKVKPAIGDTWLK